MEILLVSLCKTVVTHVMLAALLEMSGASVVQVSVALHHRLASS